QFLEIVAAAGLLEPLVVHREALDDQLPQPLRGPDTELRAPQGLDAVAHGDDDIQAVVLRVVLLAVGGSYPEIPDSCRLLEFPLIEDVADVFADRAHVLLEQVGHHLLRQPDGFSFDANLNPRLAVDGLVEEEFARVGRHEFAAHDFPRLWNPSPFRLARI